MSESEQSPTADMDVKDDAATSAETPNASEARENDAAYWQAEAEKWKAQSRKHEKAAKAKPAEAQPVQPSDEIQALRADWAHEKAQDKLDAAAAKAGVDVSDILEFVAVDKFINDGQVDTEAITEFVGKFAAKTSPKTPKFKQGIGVGPQAGGSNQLSRADMKNMSPEQIVKATEEGRFDHLLGRSK